MATRHPIIVDSDGLFREIGPSDVIDLSNNKIVGVERIDTRSLRIVNDSEVVFVLPQNRGYFGQTLVTDNSGNVNWQSLNSVSYTDSELLFAFNNSISQLHHDYVSADSDAVAFLVTEFIAADAQLKTEITNDFQIADSNLQNQINTEASTRSSNVQSLLNLIQSETNIRRNADSDLGVELLKVREKADSDWVLRQIKRLDVDSDWITRQIYTKAQSDSDARDRSQITRTFYVNTNGNTFANAITKAGTSIAQQIVLPPGSLNSTGSITTITNANILNITGPVAPSAAPAVEVLGRVVLTGAASTRVRFSHVQFDSEFELNGTQGRHSFKGVVFEKAMRITGSTTNFLIFEDCSFDGGFIVPNTFSGLIFLLRCSFNNIAPTLGQFSSQQVIMTQCTNLPSFPTNATVSGLNSLTNGFVRENINELFIGRTRINPNIDSDWIRRQIPSAQSFVQVSDEFTATANQTSFTLTQTPSGSVAMFRNGVRIRPAAITVNVRSLTYSPSNNAGSTIDALDSIVFDYIRSA